MNRINNYTKYLRSLDMLMSIEIDKSRYKSIASPENFVIIDFYRQIKLINRQLSSTIDLSTSFPMIDFDGHVTSCVTSLHIPWPIIYSHTKLQTNRGHYKTEVTEILSEENP